MKDERSRQVHLDSRRMSWTTLDLGYVRSYFLVHYFILISSSNRYFSHRREHEIYLEVIRRIYMAGNDITCSTPTIRDNIIDMVSHNNC